MSNMCPQVPALNRVSWKALETKCRSLVLTEDTLYIVCGPVYSKVHKPLTINCILSPVEGHKPSIDVPIGFFKVVLSLRQGHAKAIGFFFLNNSQKQPLETIWLRACSPEHPLERKNSLKPFETFGATSVDQIEKLTGIDFFYQLEDTFEEELESRFNLKDWR